MIKNPCLFLLVFLSYLVDEVEECGVLENVLGQHGLGLPLSDLSFIGVLLQFVPVLDCLVKVPTNILQQIGDLLVIPRLCLVRFLLLLFPVFVVEQLALSLSLGTLQLNHLPQN